MSSADISVVIPVYNRGTLIRHTLDSVAAASSGLRVEVIVVDDGSKEPVAADLNRLGRSDIRVIRQDNQGLLFARLTGLAAVTGRHVLFLDSDDLVSAGKLAAHVAALDAGADVSYTDSAGQALADQTGASGPPDPADPLPVAADGADFFITIQPAPHSPAFRLEYLRDRVAAALFPPSPLYNPVAEIWFYHICAPFPARVVKSPGLALIGRHEGVRLTNHWERLAVASLAVQEAFARVCPDTPPGRRARTCFAAKAFTSWRRLPRHFSPEFCERQLDLWRRFARDSSLEQLGGPLYRTLARGLGPERAGRCLRLRNSPYDACRTIDDSRFTSLLAALPSP